MKIFVKVKAGAKIEKLERTGANNFKISVAPPAKEGKANEAVLKALAEHFGVAPSRIKILSGHASRQKVLDIQLFT